MVLLATFCCRKALAVAALKDHEMGQHKTLAETIRKGAELDVCTLNWMDVTNQDMTYFLVGNPYMSNEKRAPGWLFDIGDYTTQLYRDYNEPL